MPQFEYQKVEIPKVGPYEGMGGNQGIPMTVTMTDDVRRRLYRILMEFHPLYQRNFQAWQKFLDSYRGGFKIHHYLIRHLRESPDNYDIRKKRLTYLNYCKPIIQLYLDYVFRQNIIRECNVPKLAGEYETFCDDCDNNGASLDEFMRQSALYAKIFGHCWILTDMPPGAAPRSEAERKERKLRPYFVNYTPLDVVNWEVDEQGNLDWVRIREIVPQRKDIFIEEKARGRITQEQLVDATAIGTAGTGRAIIYRPERSPFAMGLKKTDFIFTTWTKTGWIRHKIHKQHDVEEIGYGEHGLGRVPIVIMYHERSLLEDVIGESFLCDISGMNLLILNWLSLLDEEIAQKTLNILTIQSTPNIPSEIVIGASNVLEYSGEKAPSFIAPAAEPGEMIQKSILSIRDEIYRQARLTGGMGVLKEMKSGLSLSYGFQETGQALADTADSIEQAESRCMEVWAKWYQQEWKGRVSYPDDFGVEDLPADMEVIGKAEQLVKSLTFRAKVQFKVAEKILPKMTEEDKQKVREEIVQGVEEDEKLQKEERKAELDAAKNPPQLLEPAPGKIPVVEPPGKVPLDEPPSGTRRKTAKGLSNRGRGVRGMRKQQKKPQVR